MHLISTNLDPTDRQIRQFSSISFLVLPFVGWLWEASVPMLGGLTILGGFLVTIGFFAPSIVKPLFILVTILTTPIGWVLGEVVMVGIYLGVFLPIGLVFRLNGRDALAKRMAHDGESNWRKKTQPRGLNSYFQQW
jgi:polyferredoxin